MAMLTDLEGAVLGVIWSDGPLSAYAIRSTFLKSRSSHFSGSAGAIYPLLARMEKAGLVLATSHQQGKRKSQRVSVSSSGKAALRQWLSMDKAEMASVDFDPLRTRAHFLGILTPRQRIRFLEEGMAALQDEIEATESLVESRRESGDRWGAWGAIGALRTLQARLGWLQEMRASHASE